MKLNKITLFMMLFLTSIISLNATAQTNEVFIDKVAYCRAPWPLCNDRTRTDYKLWETHGVPDQAQKETYIGKYNIPKPDFVKNIVFLTAGQRGGLGLGGVDQILDQANIVNEQFLRNSVTGQPSFERFGNQVRGDWKTITRSSIAYQMFDRDIYSLDDTFAALAFDARFNHNFASGNKAKIVDAYYDWLKSKATDMSQVESVYLGGHSRGGSLVLRLAQRFKREFPDLKVIVHAFDPVPKRTQRELGVELFGRTTNPFNSDYHASNTYFQEEFPNTNNLSIYNFLSGEEVLLGARSVSQAGTEGQVTYRLDGFYTQQWFDLDHQDISRSSRVIEIALNDLEFQLSRNNFNGASAIFNLMLSDDE